MNKQQYISRGKKVFTKEGYVLVYCPEYPYAKPNKYVFEHRLVMANYLGRPLLPTEHIHHKNGNKADNRIENLQMFTNSEHRKEHWKKATSEERSRLSEYGKRYAAEHKKPRILIPCACGCGQLIMSVDKKGRDRKYALGHNKRKKQHINSQKGGDCS